MKKNAIFLMIIGDYQLFLTIFGTITNMLTCMVCLKKCLRATPTFVFLAYIAAFDIIPLYLLNINDFTRTTLGVNIESPIYCALFPAVHSTFLETTSWLLVSMTIERCLCVKVKTWRIKYFNNNKSHCLTFLILFIFTFLNFQQFFNTPYMTTPVNMTNHTMNISTCKLNDLYFVWAMVHTYAYSIIPFALIAISNTVLLYLIISGNPEMRIERSRTRKRTISVSVILVSVCFILFTMPHSIAVGYFLPSLLDGGEIIGMTTNALMFTYHSSHMVILTLTNKRFCNELKAFLNCKKVNRIRQSNTIPLNNFR